jgi:hypothetical protein
MRFLVRASLLLAAMLVLWGAVLLDPLRAGLRVFTVGAIWLIPGDGSVARAGIQPNGDWSFRLPMPAAIARTRSLEVVIEGKFPVLFTAGLPFYWALILASGWTWRRGRWLLEGSAVLFAIAGVSLAGYAIRTAIKNTHLVTGRIPVFAVDCGGYFLVNVIPYLAPLLLALYVDVDLRALVFTGEADDSRPAAPGMGRKKVRAGA